MSEASVIRAVVDANILVSAILSPLGNPARLLARWLAGDFTLLTAPALLTEIEDVLSRQRIRRRMEDSGAAAEGMMAALAARAEVVTPLPIDRLPVLCRDPKDNPLPACALGGHADFPVTGDGDLLVLNGDERLGELRIVRARDFLDQLTGVDGQADERSL